MKSVWKRIIGYALVIALIITASGIKDINITFASENPNVILYVHGEDANGGPVFNGVGNIGGGLWQPGTQSSGTLRIYNNYSDRIRVENLGLSLKLEKFEEGVYKEVADAALYESMAKNMKLKVMKGKFLIFSDIIYDNSFFEMMYEKDSGIYKGYDLDADKRFNIGRNDFVDLKYTVSMDENAGNELQGLRAIVAFIVNSNENPMPYVPVIPGAESTDNTSEGQTIEEPLEIIPDIAGHWAQEYITGLIDKGIITGYPDGSIRPDNFITRNEAAVLIAKALGLKPTENYKFPYRDRIDSWCRGYVAAVTEKGIFIGFGNGRFMGSSMITRQEMATALMRAFLIKPQSTIELDFIDREDIGDWALEHVKAAVENKIIEGYPDKTYKPKEKISRAEAFKMIYFLIGLDKK